MITLAKATDGTIDADGTERALYMRELRNRTGKGNYEWLGRNDLTALATMFRWFPRPFVAGEKVTHKSFSYGYGVGTVLRQYANGMVGIEWEDGSRFHVEPIGLTRV